VAPDGTCLLGGTLSDGYRYALLDQYLNKKAWLLTPRGLMARIQRVVNNGYKPFVFTNGYNPFVFTPAKKLPKVFTEKRCEALGEEAIDLGCLSPAHKNLCEMLGSNVTTVVDMRTQKIYSFWFASDWRHDIDAKLVYRLGTTKRKA